MASLVITIAQQKGGSGKTTLAANLAIAATLKGKSVGILDTDPQGSLGRWFMQRCDHMGEDNTGLHFRTASAWGARFEAKQLQKTCDLVIIDTPPKMGSDGRPSIQAANLVLIPVTPSPLDVWATEPTLELAKAEQVPHAVILNKCDPRTRMTQGMDSTLEQLGAQALPARINNRVLFAEAMQMGKGVQELRSTSPAAADAETVFGAVMDVLEKSAE